MVPSGKRFFTSLIFIFLTFFSFAPHTVHAVEKLTINVPDTVAQGDTFQVAVEDADSALSWAYDQYHLTLMDPSNAGSNTHTFKALVTGEAWVEVFADKSWGRGTVVIEGAHTTKPEQIGVAPSVNKQQAAINLLNKGIANKMDPIKFFNEMGNQGLSVRDMVEAKAAITNNEAKRLMGEDVNGADAVKQAVQFWNNNYQTYEQNLMQARLDGVNQAWDAALLKYVELHPDFPYLGAKMDIGGWAKESKADMRFEGDIDFSMIMVTVEAAAQLRDLFEGEIKQIFNMDMVDVDALGTAHRGATASVYIGNYGAKWAEIDAIRRGNIYALEVVNGKVVPRLIESMDEKIKMFAMLENNEYKKEHKIDILDKIIAEGEPQPKADMEPGVSMEFLRHVTKDSIGTNLTIIEKIIKISKYVDRSAADHAGFLKGVEGFTLVAKDTALVKGVAKVMEIKKEPATTPQEKAKKVQDILTAADGIMGKGWTDDPQKAFEALGQRAVDLITHNITEGINARRVLIERIQDPQEQANEEKRLLDDIENEYKVFAEEGVKYPDYAMEIMKKLSRENLSTRLNTIDGMKNPDEQSKARDKLLNELIEKYKAFKENKSPTPDAQKYHDYSILIMQKLIVDHINARLKEIAGIKNPDDQSKARDKLLADLEKQYKIFDDDPSKFPDYAAKTIENLQKQKGYISMTADQLRKMAEMVQKARDNGETMRFAMGIVWEGLIEIHGTTDGAINGLNNVLDFMDNATLEKLRSYQIVEGEVGPNGGIVVRDPIGIAKINQQLNDTILGSISKSVTFKGINLAMEGYAYYKAYMAADNWEDGMKNVAWEFFKRRAPGVQIAEAYYQEDYFRVGRETVYTIFPPLAIPEGLYGLAASAADWGVGYYEQLSYEYLVDALYTSSRFKETKDGKAWELTGIEYDCSGKMVKLTRQDLSKLTDECHDIRDVFYTQIKTHPVLVQFEKMLGDKLVSDGVSHLVREPYPYSYDGLTIYGAKLQKLYHDKTDQMVEKYLQGLISGLEKRKALDHDLRAQDLYALQKKYKCDGPILELTGYNTKEERGQVEELFKLDQVITQANATIDELVKTWQVDFLEKFDPMCGLISFRETGEKAEKLSADIKKALQTASKDVRGIVGGENCTPDNLQKPTIARLRMILYDNGSKEYDLWYNKYQQALDELKNLGIPLTVTLNGPVTICPGQHVKFATNFNKGECPECTAEWILVHDKGGKTVIEGGNKNGLEWIPQDPVSGRLYVKVLPKGAFSEISDYMTVSVLEPDKCSDLSIRLRSIGTELPLGDTMMIQAVPVSLGPDNEPFTRFFWSKNFVEEKGTDEDTFYLSTKGHKVGEDIVIELTARTKNNQKTGASLIVTVVPKLSDGLTVGIEPFTEAMSDMDSITFSAVSTKKSGKDTALLYHWTVDGHPMGEDKTFVLSGQDRFGKLNLSLYVQEVKGETFVAEGRESYVIQVTATGEIPVVLDKYATTIPDNKDFNLCVKSPDPARGNYSYEYAEKSEKGFSDNRIFNKQNCFTFAPSGLSDHEIVFRIQVKDEKDRMGEVLTKPIKIVSAEPEATEEEKEIVEEDADQIKAEQGKAEKEKLAKEQAEKSKKEQEAKDKEVKDKVAKDKAQKEKEEKEEADKELAEKQKQEEEAAKKQEENVVYKFGGIAPSNWEGGGDDTKFGFTRKTAESVNPHEMCTKASVTGHVKGKLTTWYEPKPLSELTKGFPDEIAEHKRWSGRTAEIKSFSMGGFTGQMVETNMRFKGGSGSPMSGYLDSSTSVSAHGFVVKGSQYIEFSYSVYGGGCFNNTDRSFQEAQVRAGQAEAKSILSSINLVKDGKFEVVPYTGPKMDGSDLAKVSLNPESLQKLKVGDTATITAVVENAQAEDSPFTYSWTGEVTGQGQSVTIKAKEPGKFSVSVSVDGARYPLGSASLEYEVEDFQVKIERVPNKQDPVAIGGSIGLKAILLSGGKPASGSYFYRFQPHPEVTFKDLDSTSPLTTATFTRLGSVKVWVQVLKKEGATLSTVAESDQIDINISKPKLTLTATPQTPLVGELVTLKASEDPTMDDKTVSFWWEYKGNTMNAGALANERDYTFIPKDTKPIVVTVHGKGLNAGDDLGEQSVTVTAKPYKIEVSKPNPSGPTPQIWKEGKGLVDVENEIAVFQDVSVSTSVSPTPKNLPLRYKWSVNPEGCVLSSPSSQETTGNASKTGSYNLTVTVTDSKGIELGTGKGTLSVTISKQDITAGKQASQTATKKLTEAKETAHQGKYDEAIADAEQAQAADPKNTEISNLIKQVKADKEKADQWLQQTDQLIKEENFVEAQKALNNVTNQATYYPPAQEMVKKLRDEWAAHDSKVKEALGDVQVKMERRDFKEALVSIDNARRTLKFSPSELKTLSDNESYCRERESIKEQARALFKSSKAKLATADYDGCLEDFKQGFNISSNLWNINTDSTPMDAEKIRNECLQKKSFNQTSIAFTDGAIRSELTAGWDAFNEPLSSGEVIWQVNGNLLKVVFQLRGAHPGHTYTVGCHFFDSKPFTVNHFLGYTLSANSDQITREGKNAHVYGYDFGKLTTDSRGNGTAEFSGSIPSGNYPLQFTVRIGECLPSQGVTGGCDCAYRTGKRFGETLEQVRVGAQ